MIGRFVIVLIKTYQYVISPLLGKNCRFYPSCSHYGIAVFEKYPLHIAFYRTCKRILSCHPWHPGGIDLP